MGQEKKGATEDEILDGTTASINGQELGKLQEIV